MSRSTVVLWTAVAATGLVVSAGVLKAADAVPHVSTMADGVAPAVTQTLSKADLARREAAPVISRSDRRPRTDPAKTQTLGVSNGGAVSGREDLAEQDPQTIAVTLLPEYGFDSSQMSCLIPLWDGESGWRVNAENVSSGAYGIPQSLPASKMATAGADYLTNPVTQIKWGLGYIRSSYGSPCGAYDFKQGHGWY
ncbi:MAG: lytic transglycosylase domain-containing protein [Nocardioides sp.]